MARAAELARALVEYDEELAARVLGHLCADLGGPASEGEPDLRKMRAFLAQPPGADAPDVGDRRTSTAQWKVRFGRDEAARSLAAAIAAQLDG